jgi:hypothetical protein
MQGVGMKGGRKSKARTTVIGGGLVVVLCAFGARQLLRAPADSAGAEAGPAAGPADASAPQQGQPPKYEVDWNLALARDPFTSDLVFPPKQPVVVPTPETPHTDKVEELAQLVRKTIKLNGTFLGSHPLAIINGKTFRTGDRVEGFVLLHIEGQKVVLEKDGVKLAVAAEGSQGR